MLKFVYKNDKGFIIYGEGLFLNSFQCYKWIDKDNLTGERLLNDGNIVLFTKLNDAIDFLNSK